VTDVIRTNKGVDVTRKAITCVLTWLLAVPAAPLMAKDSAGKGESPYWIEATLDGVDAQQRSVSYRVATGGARTAAVASDAALKKLSGLKLGHQVKLKCTQTKTGDVVVEDARNAKGTNWWKWGVLAALAAVLIGFIIAATTWGHSSGGLL